MYLDGGDRPRDAPPPRHRRPGGGQAPSGELRRDLAAPDLDVTRAGELAEGLGEEDQALARQAETAQQRLVEHEHGRALRLGCERRIVAAQRFGGEPDLIALARS